MKSNIVAVLATAFLLVSCSSPETALAPSGETVQPTPTDSSIVTETNTLPPATITTIPWEPLVKDEMGDWLYRCKVSGTSFDIVEILPGVEATGFLLCQEHRIPAGIYDRNNNVLYYWALYPIAEPEIIDHLGERGVERVLKTNGLGETYLDADNLIGIELVMSINLPNDVNRAVFDTQNIGRFAGEYWGSQEAVDAFAASGVLPNSDNIIYPISLGIVK